LLEAVTELKPKLQEFANCKLHARTEPRCSSFSNQIVNLWNNLNENTVSAESTDVFKRRMDAEWSDKPWRFDWDAPESN